MQEIIVFLILGITIAIVIYKTYRKITSKNSTGCNCNGCSKCNLKK